MGITLYYLEDSPPVRNAWMALAALDLKIDFKVVDVVAGENRTPDYLALNPLGTIPCLTDGDYVIYQSQAIAQYACNAYEKGDTNLLYPKDPKQRGIVDQVMYVSVSCHDLIQKYVNFLGVCFYDDVKPNEEHIGEVKKVLDICEEYLKNTTYMAANHLTIADFFMLGPILQLELPRYSNFGDYPRTVEWVKTMKSLKYFDKVHKQGMGELDELYQKKLNSQK